MSGGRGRLMALMSFWLFIGGCVGVPPEARFDEAQKRIEEARKANAYLCAPRELAIAQGNMEFARAELELGAVARAVEHLEEAELNAAAALQRIQGGCAASSVNGASAPALRDAGADRDGDGVPDRVDLCPDDAEDLDGTVDRDGCPDPDNDGDRIEDVRDNCPDAPEDMDGFEDEDGCPEVDNDGDGVLDGLDACPLVRGQVATDGCPSAAYAGVKLGEHELVLSNRLSFVDRSTTLPEQANAVLDAIAQLLLDRPALRLEVAAHTDSRGEEKSNLALTLRQAEVVREALVARGVQAARLTVKGYGETRPLESNRTSLGRAANRRVEFLRAEASSVAAE